MPKFLAQSNAVPRGAVPEGMDVGQLYRCHHPWLVGWLRRKLADGRNAVDVSHDRFLRLLSLNNLDSLREPRAYLLVIASRLHDRQMPSRQGRERVRTLAAPTWPVDLGRMFQSTVRQ